MPGRQTAAAPLPAISQNEQPEALRPAYQLAFPLTSVTCRLYNPDTGATFALGWHDTPLEIVEEAVALYIEQGYRPSQAPDAPLARPPAPADEAPRAGQRAYLPKDDRLVLPFALKGQYKGWTLQAIEAENPAAIDWLATNAFMDDIKKAAKKVMMQRDDSPF